MTHSRALHNPPVAVPCRGLPNQRSAVESEYLLVCEARCTSIDEGRWRFTLEAADGELILEAEDRDRGDLNRLTLLAAVRGLESLEGASGVTLLSNNRYLIRSLSNSLPRWRQNNFVWEHFGRRIDVQHADLWRRIDHALQIHRVQACLVSSCLVSHGQPEHSTDKDDDAKMPQRRVDAAHSSGSVPPPSDRLRSLLLGQAPAEPPASSARRRGKFSAIDLESG